MTLLKEIMFSYDQFTFTLPSEVGKLINLETLNLSNNLFSGNAIDAITCALTKLKILIISKNIFGSSVENLSSIKSLGRNLD